MFGEYVNKLGNPENTNNYQQLYEKHNKEHGIVIGDGNYSNDINESSEHRLGDVDKNINPVEGGLEDMTTNWSEGQVKSGKKHRRDRENRKGIRHHKSVKKELSEDEKGEKVLIREKRIKNQNSKTITENHDENNYNGDGIDIDRFYKEHPNFESNAATISDNMKVETYTSTPVNYATSRNTESSTSTDVVQSDSEDDAYMKIKFDNEDVDDDQSEVGLEESKSGDESNKAFVDYYNYYDKTEDSSYSSSEETAEQDIQNQTPYDWFQQYDRMYGDQPAQSETQSEKSAEGNTSSEDKHDQNKYNKAIEDKRYVTGDKDNIPKTDIEPSTSPNPPTPKKDMKSTVTQPAYPQWKERVETWNLIESKPIGRWWDVWCCAYTNLILIFFFILFFLSFCQNV